MIENESCLLYNTPGGKLWNYYYLEYLQQFFYYAYLPELPLYMP